MSVAGNPETAASSGAGGGGNAAYCLWLQVTTESHQFHFNTCRFEVSPRWLSVRAPFKSLITALCMNPLLFTEKIKSKEQTLKRKWFEYASPPVAAAFQTPSKTSMPSLFAELEDDDYHHRDVTVSLHPDRDKQGHEWTGSGPRLEAKLCFSGSSFFFQSSTPSGSLSTNPPLPTAPFTSDMAFALLRRMWTLQFI
ncbi:hypothetical protein NQZ68_007090 [Dissostichus eleginoides]|nr:hypothetical protein NQZ68_007090 [Dissostichus eleginoides]